MRIRLSREQVDRLAGGRAIGAGDLIAKVTRLLGLKSCAGCERRRQSLNRLVLRPAGGSPARMR